MYYLSCINESKFSEVKLWIEVILGQIEGYEGLSYSADALISLNHLLWTIVDDLYRLFKSNCGNYQNLNAILVTYKMKVLNSRFDDYGRTYPRIHASALVRECIFFVIHRSIKRAIVQDYTESIISHNDISLRSQEGMDIEFRIFLGWAIHSLIDLYCKKQHSKENEAKLEFLRNLRMLEKSFTNENRESASRIWKTLNKGGLCYPKDELRDFGVTILNTIATNINIDAYGNGAISIVHDIL